MALPSRIDNVTRVCRAANLVFIGVNIAFAAALFGENRIIASETNAGTALASVLANPADLPIYIGIAAVGFVIILLFTFIANGVWLYCASKNAAHLQPIPKRISPGWTVGWHIIPVANLWMPYKAAKQLYVSSVTPEHSFDEAAPGWFRMWWLLWLVGNLLSTLSGNTSDTDAQAYMMANWLSIASCLVNIPCTLLFMRLQSEVSEAQEARDWEEVREAAGMTETSSVPTVRRS